MSHKNSVIESIKKRYSCRTFDPKPLEEQLVKKLNDFIVTINAKTKIKARFICISNNEGDGTPVKLGTYGMISGATNYIVGICEKDEKNYVDFGYLFEEIVLHATGIDLQTCWLGGTFNRDEFTQKCNLKENEYIAIVSPFGMKKKTPRLFESAVRVLVGANNRKPFSELFFENDLSTPLNESSIVEYITPLEMVRLSPSASNKQPCRIIKTKDGYNFYLKRTKNYPTGLFDMQKNDIGIAMCHFELTSKELSLIGHWGNINSANEIKDLEYITTWVEDLK
ncbi:MAG: nitroreductase family protein [Bacillota bacterium]